MNVAIVGSRNYPDLESVRRFVRTLPMDTVVITGGAFGVDLVAAEEAHTQKLQVKIILPDWKTYGKAAEPIRNRQIVDVAEKVVAFHDGMSRGTQNTIDLARATGKPTTVYSPS